MQVSYSKIAAFLAVLVVAYMTSAAVKAVPSSVSGAVAGYSRTLVKHASHPLEDGSDALQRDPFAKPGDGRFGADGKAASGGAVEDLSLTGVVFSGRRRVAYIDGKRLREGDRVGAFIVRRIEFNRVAVDDGDRTYDLWLNASPARTTRPGDVRRASAASTRATGIVEFPEVLAGPRPAKSETAKPGPAEGG